MLFRQLVSIETPINVTFPRMYRLYNNILNLNVPIVYGLHGNILNCPLGSYIVNDYIIRFYNSI